MYHDTSDPSKLCLEPMASGGLCHELKDHASPHRPYSGPKDLCRICKVEDSNARYFLGKFEVPMCKECARRIFNPTPEEKAKADAWAKECAEKREKE